MFTVPILPFLGLSSHLEEKALKTLINPNQSSPNPWLALPSPVGFLKCVTGKVQNRDVELRGYPLKSGLGCLFCTVRQVVVVITLGAVHPSERLC